MRGEGADTEGTAYLFRRDTYDVTHYNYEAAVSRMAHRADRQAVMQNWEQEFPMSTDQEDHERKLAENVRNFKAQGRIHPSEMSTRIFSAYYDRMEAT